MTMRTKSLTSVLFLLLSGAALAQKSNPKVVVETQECKLWAGIHNYIQIMIEGQDSVSLDQIKVTNATIRKEGKYFILQPKEVGELEMTISTAVGSDRRNYRVKAIEVTPMLGGKHVNGAVMGNGEFKAQGGVAAVVTCCGFDAKCDVKSYNVLRIAADGSTARVSNKGVRFDAESQAIIMQARPGDMYLFFEILTRCPGDVADRDLGSILIHIR